MRLLKILSVLLFMGAMAPALQANHILGGNLSFDCLGGDNYGVTLTYYADCFGSTPPTPTDNIFFLSTSGSCLAFSAAADLTSVTEISDLCALEAANTSCNGGLNPGTNMITYYVEVYLDPSCTWDIVWSSLDYDEYVNLSIPDPFNPPDAYVLTQLDPSFGCYDSPDITTDPQIPYFCAGEAASYTMDIDVPAGFTYDISLTPVLYDGAVDATYEAGYDANEPIPGITFDPATNTFDFTAPNQFGNYVAGVEIILYDGSGNMVSTTTQSFGFVVQLCDDSPVEFTDPEIVQNDGDGQIVGPNEIDLCVGDSLILTVQAESTNIFRTITMTSDFEALFAGGTFTTDGLNPVTGLMEGQVDESMIGTTTITVDAIDDACTPHTDQIEIIVNVYPSLTVSVADTVVCNAQELVIDVSGGANISWNMLFGTTDPGFVQGSASQTINPIEPFTVEIETDGSIAACNFEDTLVVDVSLWSITGLVTDESCNGNDGAIDLTIQGGNGTYDFDWEMGTYSTEDITGIVGGQDWTVEITNNGVSNGQPYTCVETATFTVNSDPPPSGNITGDATICAGECTDITFNLSGTAPFDVVLVDMNTGLPEATIPVSDGNTFEVCPATTTTYELQSITDSNNPQCTYTVVSSVTVTVRPIPTVAFIDPGTLCEGDMVNVELDIALTGTFNVDYSIDAVNQGTTAFMDGDVIAVTVDDPSTTISVTNIEYQDAPLCSNTTVTDLVIDVEPLPTAVLTQDETICEGDDVTLHISFTGTGPWEIEYTIDGAAQPAFNVAFNEWDWLISPGPITSTTYCLINVTDMGTNCEQTLNSCVDITVNPAPSGTLTSDGTICAGDDYAITVNLNTNGPYSLVIEDSAGPIAGLPASFNDGDTFQVSPAADETYCLTSITDANNCTTTLNSCVDVTVNSLPTVDASGSGDTDVCIGDCFDYIFSGLTGTAPFDVTWEMLASDDDAVLATGTEVGVDNGGTFQVCPAEDAYIVFTQVTDSSVPACTNTNVGVQFDLDVFDLTFVTISDDDAVCAGDNPILTFCFENYSPTDELTITLDNGQGFTVDGADLVADCWDFQVNLLDPEVSQTFVITSYINSQNPCPVINNGTVNISVNPLPDGTLTDDQVLCDGEDAEITVNIPTAGGPFDIMIQEGVDPPVPYFGIVDGDILTFSPTSSGSYTLTEITDNSLPTGCTGTPLSQVLVTVAETPSLIFPEDTLCANTGEEYQIQFQIVNGISSTYTVTPTLGNDPGGSDPTVGPPYIYTSGIIPSGLGEVWEITDQNGCGPTIVTVDPFLCPIVTYSGTNDLAAIYVCDDGILSVIHNSDEILDGNDVLNFIIQSESAQGALGVVYDVSTTGSWNAVDLIPGTLNFDTEYFVSAVAGTDADGDGFIDDFLDPNTSISEGVSVTFLETPTATISGGGTICIGEEVDIQVDFTGSVEYNFEILLDGVGQGPINNYPDPTYTETLSEAGTYTLSFVNNTYCTGDVVGSVDIVVNPLPTVAYGADAAICDGDTHDFNIYLDGTAPWDIIVEFDDGTTQSSTNVNGILVSPATFSATEEGNYWVSYVIDGNGCENTTLSNQAFLEVYPLPTAEFNFGDTAFCQGTSVELELNLTGEPNWGIDYTLDGAAALWNATDPFFETEVFAGGTYCIEGVIDGNNCANFTQTCIHVDEIPIPNADTGPDVFACSEAEVLLGIPALPDLTYEWTGDIEILDDPTIAQPTASSVNTAVGNQTYNLTLTVTEGECVNTSDLVFTIYPQTPAEAGASDSICYNEPYQLNASGGLSCQWEDNGTFIDMTNVCDPMVLPLADTEYVVTVTDANLCSYNDTLMLFVPAPFSINETFIPTVCVDSCDATIDIDVSGGWGTPTINWTSGGLTEFNNTDVCLGTYDYNVTDSLGCELSGSIIIDEFAENFIDVVAIADPDCFGTSSGVISADDPEAEIYFLNGENSNFSGQWNDLPAGDYTILTADANQCGADTMVTLVAESPEIFFDAGFDTTVVCVETPVNFTAAAAGGIPDFNYFWYDDVPPAGTLLGTGDVLTVTPDDAPYTVYAYAEDANGCSTDTLAMTAVYDPPLQAFGFPNFEIEICQGDCVDLTATASGGNGNYSYEWYQFDTFSDIFLTDQSFQQECPTESQAYILWVYDGCQHPVTDTVYVITHETPDVEIGADIFGDCYPFTVTLTNYTDPELSDDCMWDMGNGAILSECDELVYTYLQEGEYWPTLTVTTENGCTDTDSLDQALFAYGYPDADFYYTPFPVTTLENEVEFISTSTGAISYDWDIAGMFTTQWPNPSFSFPDQDLAVFPVCLTVWNEFGCQDTICKDIFVESELLLYAPNAFTPDNDGLNDVFLPEIRGISQDGYLFRVFDRWGHIVFETEQTGEPWIGDFERGDYYAQNDVYVWMIEAVELSTGDKKRFYGHVTMAR